MKTFYENNKIVNCMAPTTAATGASTGQVVDTAGFGGVCFVGNLGTMGSSQGGLTMAIHQSSASDAGFEAMTGATHSSTTSDRLQVIDIYKPIKRYAKAVVTRGSTDTTEHGGVVAYLYSPSVVPTTHDSTSIANSTGVLVLPVSS